MCLLGMVVAVSLLAQLSLSVTLCYYDNDHDCYYMLLWVQPRDRHLVGELMGTIRDELQCGNQQQQAAHESAAAAAAAAAAALAASGSLGPLLPIQQPQQQQPQHMEVDGLQVPGESC
jgi:hypothetical protein